MSWLEEWRKQDEKKRAARQEAKFSPEAAPLRMSAGSAAEDLTITVMSLERKYAGRWGFLDSIANMGRNNERSQETGASADTQRQREETGARGTGASGAAGEPPEPVA